MKVYDRFLKNENVFESLVDLNFIVLFVPGLYSGKIPGNRIAIQVMQYFLKIS